MTRAAYQAGHYAHDRNAAPIEAFASDRERRHDAEQGSRLLLERIHALLERRQNGALA